MRREGVPSRGLLPCAPARSIVGAVPSPAPVAGPLRPLVPVLILRSGRSGSTLLMQLLGTSPQVVFERVYPYELPYLTYLVRLAGLLREPRPSKEWQQRDLMRADFAGLLGPLPARRARILTEEADRPFWEGALQALWTEFSAHARAVMPRLLGSSGPPATLYAEKCPPWLRPLLAEAHLEHRALHVLRDPRDVYLSILAFNARRGTRRFGVRAKDTPLTFARRLARERAGLLREIAAGRIPADEVIRYEALVGDLEGEAERLGDRLGVTLDAAAVRAAEAEHAGHITAESPAASVGRWKWEMGPEVRAVFAAELGELLPAFGWEV